MHPHKRTDRVADQIKMEIADILTKKAKDPRIGFVTVMSVEVTNDLQHAKVFVSIPQHQDRKETITGLRKGAGFVRKELARRLSLRRIPDLAFLVDRSTEQVTHVLTLLEQIKEDAAHQGEIGDQGTGSV
ncbi:MAG: 30S ribosome-binding factor RbfA [Nitrospiria bacterium]